MTKFYRRSDGSPYIGMKIPSPGTLEWFTFVSEVETNTGKLVFTTRHPEHVGLTISIGTLEVTAGEWIAIPWEGGSSIETMPFDMFEELFSADPPAADTTWQDRLCDELSELQKRIGKLNSFLESDQFDKLDDIDKRLLIDQRGFMLNYHGILRLRISRAGK